jgi:CDP-4-dehydro-6-deoxyglucose reductase
MQQQVRNGELPLSDGLVSTEALLRLYPQAKFEESGLLERVARIKEEAFGKRVRERLLPSQEILAQRLFGQSQELADLRRHLQRYHHLVVTMKSRIGDLATVSGSPTMNELNEMVSKGLSEVLATEPVDVLDAMDDMLKVMSAQVTVRPSGHEFSVEGQDSLLQAGLRAGLKLNYGCGNGSCGLCKARVVAGEVARTQPYDYPLSEAEKLQGYTLLCAHTAASSDLTIETLEARGPQDMPEQQIVTKVRALTRLGEDTALLHLQTPRTNRLRFLAGQSVVLGLAGAAQDCHGDYPIASCPCDDRNLHFYVARNSDDAFAEQIFSGNLRSGDPVTVWGPEGNFVLLESQRPLVFAACDVGFGPIKGLIEHALAIDAAPSLSLFWLATRADGHFLANQCRAWSEALDQFEYSLHSDADAATGALRVAQAIRADLFDIECEYYLAGPKAFVDTLGAELLAAGVPMRQLCALAV